MDSADWENLDDWELINHDGFVYKRKKRPRLDSVATTSSGGHQTENPEAERKTLRERKKRALLKLRDKYLKEIHQWELLSNTFKEMEANAQTQFQERQGLYNTTSLVDPSSSEEHSVPNSTCRRLVDDLLSQVEAQEAIIRSVSNLCDVAEALCSAHEERLKQQFTDLPIWEPSPRELMEALSEQ